MTQFENGNDPVLKVKGLVHQYENGVRALDGVDLEIPTGLFGLLGPNGAGKSSLMRCLATLQLPTAGAIRFGNIDVIQEPTKLREILGYLPQDFGVYPRISAFDLLEHLAVLKGLGSRTQRREQVAALLAKVNLWEHRNKAVFSFSGGMRQRFGIAQALLGSPSLIVVDEPTAGLDPEERSRFNNLLSEIGEQIVVILSTHIVDDVEDLCSRMAILCGGKILAQGDPRKLSEQLRGRLWIRQVDRNELVQFQSTHQVVSTRLRAGSTFVKVVSETTPESGFAPVDPQLEDFYFWQLHGVRSAPIPALT